MAKQKIAILGGGVAGLSAAYELSKTPLLRSRYEITVYQLGWRLGGKIASGRDSTGCNLEHGLHVWFGCYENAFRMLKDVYASYAAGGRFTSWNDVMKGQSFTPIGVMTSAGWTYWPVTWPQMPGEPGEGGLDLSLWEMVTRLIGLLRTILEDFFKLRVPITTSFEAGPPPLPRVRFRAAVADGLRSQSAERHHADTLATASEFEFRDVVAAAHLWAMALGKDALRFGPSHPEGIVALLAWLKEGFNAGLVEPAVAGPASSILRELLDIATAFISGVWRDILWPDKPFESLDHLEFRDWLIANGADSDIVAQSSIVRALYDTAFQYVEGDIKRPSYAAGTAVGVLIRLIATYKGDMLWEVQTGMGEAVIAPLYKALVANNVEFAFFHKLGQLEVSGADVERIHMIRQADVISPPYIPTKDLGDLTYWPSEPFWDQLVDGLAMASEKVDFESHWCTKSTDGVTLQRGVHFDTVVLAISMGAYKPLNREPGMCDQVIACSSRFARFVSNIPIVPTLAMQLWCDATTAELGWRLPKPAAVAGPEPFSVWADMTQVLAVEPRTEMPRPASLHYLVGPFATDLYKAPSTQTNTPGAAAAFVKAKVVSWLQEDSCAAWPLASDGGMFHWDMLNDPKGRKGKDRVDAQYCRANVNPSDCCVGSPAGTTQYRLLPEESGLTNLFLAGEATRTGCNTSSIEGAVMSGMAASRAICGEPREIVGFDFLRLRPSEMMSLRPSEMMSLRPSEMRRVPREDDVSAPPYISWTGHGNACGEPPGSFSDAVMHMFGIEADGTAMQALVDKLLNSVRGTSVNYTTFVDAALLTFVDIGKCTTHTEIVGWVPGRECALWIPLLESSGLGTRVVFWSPYIFIDYCIGLVTGREVWGWSKVSGDIDVLPRGVADPRFSVSTLIFSKFAATTKGSEETLMTVAGSTPLTMSPLWGSVRAAMPAIIGRLMRMPPNEVTARFDLHPVFPAIALKQFRDSDEPKRACFQAIVNSPVRLTHFEGGGFHSGTFELRVKTCDSHKIIYDFTGRTPTSPSDNLAVRFAAWIRFNFEADRGSVITRSI